MWETCVIIASKIIIILLVITEQMPLRQAYFDSKFKTFDLFLNSYQFKILFVKLKGCFN